MSLRGGGEIVVLPMAAVAGVALLAAAGVAVVGGVAVYQLGRGLVACGRKVNQLVQAHADRRRAVQRMCQEYEDRVRQAASESAAIGQTGAAQARAALLARSRARTPAAETPAPEPPLPLTADAGLQEEPAPPLVLFDAGDLERRAAALAAEAGGLEACLDALERAEWVGLVSVNDLRAQLATLRASIRQHAQARTGEDVRTARDLHADLATLRAEIARRAHEGRARTELRQDAARALAHAAERLEARSQPLKDLPEWQPALSAADDLLAHANALFEAGDLHACLEAAHTVADYADHLAGSAESLRRSNLEVAVGALRDYIAGFGLPPDDPTPVPLQRLIAEAERRLAAGRLDAAWDAIARAQPEADTLASRVEARLQTAQRDAAVGLARETLDEMGYRPGAVAAGAQGEREFQATRPDGASFRIWVTPDGLLQYKAEKFGSAECRAETQRLFDGLARRGMLVNAQSEFSQNAVAERLAEIMLRQGFADVRQERAPDGQILLTATNAAGEQSQTKVAFDPAPATPSASQKAAPAEVDDERVRFIRGIIEDQQRRQRNLRDRTRLRN